MSSHRRRDRLVINADEPDPSATGAQTKALPEQARHAATETEAATEGAERGVMELTRELTAQISRLARDELALAQLEAKQRAKRIGAGAGMFGAGGGLGFFGTCCLVTAAILGLANVLRPWLAALIVGGALFVIAGLIVLPGWKSITQKHPNIPHDSVQSIKADLAAVKQAARR